MAWTDEQIATLALMAPRNSASQIANALGCGFTRNAVIGKLRRLEIPLRGGTTISAVPTGNRRGKHQHPKSPMTSESAPDPVDAVSPGRAPPKPATPPQRKPPRPNAEPAPVEPTPNPKPSPAPAYAVAGVIAVNPICSHVDFEGLKTRSCRWPVKCDDQGYIRLYCGEMAQESGPYCAAHHKKSSVVPDRRSLPNHSTKKLFGVGFA